MYGLKDERGNKLLKKPWRIVTDNPVWGDSLRVKCDKSRSHGVGRGRNVFLPSFYTQLLVKKLTKQLQRPVAQEEQPDALPAERAQRPAEEGLTPEEERALHSSIKQMHTNLGHPSNHALAKAIRVTGGSQRAVRAALELRCDVCESQRRPPPHVPGRIRMDRDFGDTVAIDLFVLADYLGNQLTFANIVDLATTFGIVAQVSSKHPQVIWSTLLERWITPFGVHKRIFHDQGGEFEREFGQELESMGCELLPTAAITPQQNAAAERHGGVWKHHARRLIDKFSVQFVPAQQHRVNWLVAAVAWACNAAPTESGYSPSQWVLGKYPRRPGSLCEESEWGQLGVLAAQLDSRTAFGLKAKMRFEAHKYFVHLLEELIIPKYSFEIY